MRKNSQLSSSFRDPSGYLFTQNGVLYRRVNKIYKNEYDHFKTSGLYKALVKKKFLIPHSKTKLKTDNKGYIVLKPERISFISYPYEWSFSQLKDAAVLTLEIQKLALSFGMTLKDASAFNVQFHNGKPIFIDTLSFEFYKKGTPWVAYRQFCQHFLAPLSLMAYKDVRLSLLLKEYLDGLPLALASSLLPRKTLLNFALLSHIHLHAKTQGFYKDKKINLTNKRVSLSALLGLAENLESVIKSLEWKPMHTQWGNYYQKTNYTSAAMNYKKRLVGQFLKRAKDSRRVWDLGANTGVFSRIAADYGSEVISFDIDPAAVEKNYMIVKKKSERNLLPLLLDITNPSPAIGWENEERMSLIDRGPTDCVIALALVHHLVIGNNLPFEKLTTLFGKLGKWLIIEFVPKNDSQVKKLLVSREDIFTSYNQTEFEKVFGLHFTIKSCKKIKGTKRLLYLMCKND